MRPSGHLGLRCGSGHDRTDAFQLSELQRRLPSRSGRSGLDVALPRNHMPQLRRAAEGTGGRLFPQIHPHRPAQSCERPARPADRRKGWGVKLPPHGKKSPGLSTGAPFATPSEGPGFTRPASLISKPLPAACPERIAGQEVRRIAVNIIGCRTRLIVPKRARRPSL